MKKTIIEEGLPTIHVVLVQVWSVKKRWLSRGVFGGQTKRVVEGVVRASLPLVDLGSVCLPSCWGEFVWRLLKLGGFRLVSLLVARSGQLP